MAIPGTPGAQHGALYAGRGGQRSGGQQIGLAREGWLTHGGFGGRHGGAAATAHRRLSWGGWGRWDRPVGANLGLWDLSVKSLFWIHRSEEHTSELQSLMRISYAVFCLKKKQHQEMHKHANRTYMRK